MREITARDISNYKVCIDTANERWFVIVDTTTNEVVGRFPDEQWAKAVHYLLTTYAPQGYDTPRRRS